MPNTSIRDSLEKMALGFPIPENEGFHVSLPPAKFEHLLLFGLSGIYDGMASNVASTADQIPVNASIPVDETEAGIVLSAASTKARKLSVANSGASDLVILEGDKAPGFNGQPNPAGAGNLAADFGIVIKPGGYYESPVAHRGIVRGRTRTGETTTATVTRY